MGLFSSFFSFSRSSHRRKRSHQGSNYYKRRKLSSGIISAIFSSKSFSSSRWS
ncbi:hypothetical protein [Romboutsia sp.]|uniref:hypothetical protein n=1 Tax=Romboutsia sp. TaxID=1965302 RepID=UPI003F3135AB